MEKQINLSDFIKNSEIKNIDEFTESMKLPSDENEADINAVKIIRQPMDNIKNK